MKIGTTKVDFDLPPIFHPQRHKERYFEFSSYTNFELKGSSNRCNKAAPNHSTTFYTLSFFGKYFRAQIFTSDSILSKRFEN
jgi:hypothetical protein